jgi:hypothetical protein
MRMIQRKPHDTPFQTFHSLRVIMAVPTSMTSLDLSGTFTLVIPLAPSVVRAGR